MYGFLLLEFVTIIRVSRIMGFPREQANRSLLVLVLLLGCSCNGFEEEELGPYQLTLERPELRDKVEIDLSEEDLSFDLADFFVEDAEVINKSGEENGIEITVYTTDHEGCDIGAAEKSSKTTYAYRFRSESVTLLHLYSYNTCGRRLVVEAEADRPAELSFDIDAWAEKADRKSRNGRE
ncbi:MAG: hypothetical protein ACOCV2_02630 [Persicimonas sp.]